MPCSPPGSATLSATGYLALKTAGGRVGLCLGPRCSGSRPARPGARLRGRVRRLRVLRARLSSTMRRRREGIKAELPDALDLLAVSVEAGLGFDGAIAKLTEHMEGRSPRSSG